MNASVKVTRHPVMATLPDPMTPADCDLRRHPFMAVYPAEARRERIWLKAKRNKVLGYYITNLRMASWLELPAASMPDDDDYLADAAGCDPDEWAAVRDVLLEDWPLCSDGRRYCPTVARAARDAWDRRGSYVARGQAGAEARWGSERERRAHEAWRASGAPPVDPEAPSDPGAEADPVAAAERTRSSAMPTPGQSDSYRCHRDNNNNNDKDRGTPPPGTSSQGALLPDAPAAPRKRVAKNDEPEGFAEFWAAYPKVANQSKAEARRHWPAAVRKVSGRWDLLVAAAQRYAESKAGQDPHFTRHACRWLTGELWASPTAVPRADVMADRLAKRFGSGRTQRPVEPEPDPEAWRGTLIEGEAEQVEPERRASAADLLAAAGVPL